MDIGITDFYGFYEPYKTRLNKIKANNFTYVLMSNDKRYKKQNGSLKNRVKYAKKIGLKLSSLHASYDGTLPLFNLKGKIGDKIERLLKKEAKLASKYGFKNLVVHIEGDPSEILLQRINRILKVCEKYKVNFALENLERKEIFDFVEHNIKNQMLKFCYDSGHHNCFCKDKEFFPEYTDKLTCVHLHDNNAKLDQHIPFECGGNIDITKLSKDLAKTSINCLDFEILPKILNLNPDELLKKVYENGVLLSNLINNFRQKNKRY